MLNTPKGLMSYLLYDCFIICSSYTSQEKQSRKRSVVHAADQ